jgi:hypothetical protein
VVSGLVVAGGITFGLGMVAHANTQTFCDSSATAPITCSTGSQTITSPSAITIVINLEKGDGATTPDQYVVVAWTGDCSQGGNDSTIASSTTNPTYSAVTTTAGASVSVPLPFTNPDSCDITASATLYKIVTPATSTTPATYSTNTTGTFQLELEYTPSSMPSATTSSTPPTTHVSTISGYGGKCLDDKGNSSSNRAEVIIWSCNSADSAQGWTYSGGELKHNSKCANIQGGGGSGSKLILWSCNGSSNEKWFHSSSDGEYVSSETGHGLLCVDDPAYSKTNGKQLIVYTCHNSGNQHWSS